MVLLDVVVAVVVVVVLFLLFLLLMSLLCCYRRLAVITMVVMTSFGLKNTAKETDLAFSPLSEYTDHKSSCSILKRNGPSYVTNILILHKLVLLTCRIPVCQYPCILECLKIVGHLNKRPVTVVKIVSYFGSLHRITFFYRRDDKRDDAS